MRGFFSKFLSFPLSESRDDYVTACVRVFLLLRNDLCSFLIISRPDYLYPFILILLVVHVTCAMSCHVCHVLFLLLGIFCQFQPFPGVFGVLLCIFFSYVLENEIENDFIFSGKACFKRFLIPSNASSIERGRSGEVSQFCLYM